MMALALAKKLPIFEKEGKMNWDEEYVGEDMSGKATDIIGFGAIGHALAKKLEGIVGKDEICYYSHNKNDPDYHYMDFDAMLDKSEYMFVTISKNDDSLALFNDLSKFKAKLTKNDWLYLNFLLTIPTKINYFAIIYFNSKQYNYEKDFLFDDDAGSIGRHDSV